MLNERQFNLKVNHRSVKSRLLSCNIFEFIKNKRASEIVQKIKNRTLCDNFNQYLKMMTESIKKIKYIINCPQRHFNYYFSGSNRGKFSHEMFFSTLNSFASDKVVIFILDLSGFKVYNIGAEKLGESLHRMVNLSNLRINLFGSCIGNTGLKYIAVALMRLLSLSSVELIL